MLPEVGPDDIRRGDVDVAVIEPSSRRSFRSDHSQLQQFDHGSISYAGISETARDAALAGGSQNARRLLLKAYNDDTVTQQLFFGRERSEPLEWKRTFVTHDQLTLKRLLLEHHGITVDLSILHIGEEIRRGIVVPLLEGWTKRPGACALSIAVRMN